MSITINRLKYREIEDAKKLLLEAQGYECAICGLDLHGEKWSNITLDHCHENGWIRAVLCRNCNSNLGRVWHWANRSKREGSIIQWLLACIEYVQHYEENPLNVFHPKHKTDEEKRIARNKKARRRRKKKKESKK